MKRIVILSRSKTLPFRVRIKNGRLSISLKETVSPMAVRSLIFCVFAILIFSFSGCGTLKGAADGFSKDWEKAKHLDDWIQKKAW